MKKSGAIVFGVLFLFAVLAFTYLIHSVSAVPYGDYNVCCIGTDVAGGTTGNCNSIQLASTCTVGSSISNPCYGIQGRTSSETVLQSSAVYRSTGNGLPYACDFGCPTGQKSCFIDGSYTGCIDNSLGSQTFARCTGSYVSNPSVCVLNEDPNYYMHYLDPATKQSGYNQCAQFSQSQCNTATLINWGGNPCIWGQAYSSCSTFTDNASCVSHTGCTAEQMCTYSSPSGTYNDTTIKSTCNVGICSGSPIQSATMNSTATCASTSQDCYVCNSGYTQCPTGPSCKNLNTDPLNCGTCGNDCTIQFGSVAACVSGTCTAVCPTNQSYTQNGTTFASCSGTYVTSSSCTGTYRVLQSDKNNGGSNIQQLALPTGGPYCYEFNQTGCLNSQANGCSWVNYTSSCSYLGASACSTTSGCTVNTQPTYGCVDNSLLCQDTDSPTLNYTSKGTVTSKTGVNGTDSCVAGSNNLTEHYCSLGIGSTIPFDCTTLGSGFTCSNGACVNSTVIIPKIADCQVGCNVDSDCSSNSCKTDISGTKRCVPSADVCALDSTTSCGVALGYQQCTGSNISTCASTGSFSQTFCTWGCTQPVGLAPQCTPAITAAYWMDGNNVVSSISLAPQLFKNMTILVTNKTYNGSSFQLQTSGLSIPSILNPHQNGPNLESFLNIPAGSIPGTYWAKVSYNPESNLSVVVTDPSSPSCGDGVITSPEQCDGTNLNGQTCNSVNSAYSGGTLGCYANGTANECQFDTSGCTVTDLYCSNNNVSVCGDYNSSDLCNSDSCRVASNTPPPAGTGQADRCQWDASSSTCNKVIYSQSNGTDIGFCTSKENPRTDTCADGLLSYSWNSTWAWAPNNARVPNGTEPCSVTYGPGWITGGEVNTLCHYDPKGYSTNCANGATTIACPAQVQLSFFDWRNVIAVVLIIFVLYVFLMRDKKKKSLKKTSKKRK